MTQTERDEMIEKAKAFFKENFFDINYKSLEKGLKLKKFTINPFLIDYISIVAGGDTSAMSKARALLCPRFFGTSITTSFGSKVQKFLTTIGPCKGSAVSGMDIEFIDAIDGKKKYAQLKAGKYTINHDDVEPIKTKFRATLNLARTNNLPISSSDLCVGVLYGEGELTPFYAEINKEFDVFMGKDFWHHITGSMSFYDDLIKAINEVAKEYSSAHDKLEQAIVRLATEIEESEHR